MVRRQPSRCLPDRPHRDEICQNEQKAAQQPGQTASARSLACRRPSRVRRKCATRRKARRISRRQTHAIGQVHAQRHCRIQQDKAQRPPLQGVETARVPADHLRGLRSPAGVTTLNPNLRFFIQIPT